MCYVINMYDFSIFMILHNFFVYTTNFKFLIQKTYIYIYKNIFSFALEVRYFFG